MSHHQLDFARPHDGGRDHRARRRRARRQRSGVRPCPRRRRRPGTGRQRNRHVPGSQRIRFRFTDNRAHRGAPEPDLGVNRRPARLDGQARPRRRRGHRPVGHLVRRAEQRDRRRPVRPVRPSGQAPRQPHRQLPGHPDVRRRHGRALGPAAAAGRRRARTSCAHADAGSGRRCSRDPSTQRPGAHERRGRSPRDHRRDTRTQPRRRPRSPAMGTAKGPTTSRGCWPAVHCWSRRWASRSPWHGGGHEIGCAPRRDDGPRGADDIRGHCGSFRARHPNRHRSRRKCLSDNGSHPGQRHVQRAAAAVVCRDDGSRAGWPSVVAGRSAGAGRRRQHRCAPAGADRHLHRQLPGHVGGRARGVRLVVVHAHAARHRDTGSGSGSAAQDRGVPVWPFLAGATVLIAGGALWAVRRRA